MNINDIDCHLDFKIIFLVDFFTAEMICIYLFLQKFLDSFFSITLQIKL